MPNAIHSQWSIIGQKMKCLGTYIHILFAYIWKTTAFLTHNFFPPFERFDFPIVIALFGANNESLCIGRLQELMPVCLRGKMPNYGPCPKCNPIEQITITNVITHTFTALGLILLQIGSEIGEGGWFKNFELNFDFITLFCGFVLILQKIF